MRGDTPLLSNPISNHAESDEHKVSENDRSRDIPRVQAIVKRRKGQFVTVAV